MKLNQVIKEHGEQFITNVNKNLLKLMRENPTFIYPDDIKNDTSCFYGQGPQTNPDKCKGCIFGQALQNMGWTDSLELKSGGYIRELLKVEGNFKDSPIYWMEIQREQDKGCEWGSLEDILPDSQ